MNEPILSRELAFVAAQRGLDERQRCLPKLFVRGYARSTVTL
jgi:hypothetical protein